MAPTLPSVVFPLLVVSTGYASATPGHLQRRLENGLALTPPMGWNSYNHYNCAPNESIIVSNAQALVDLGLAELGYHYVTTDCGWTIPQRTANGTLTWNETLFPRGFPALGEFIHSLGLGFGVYSDAGVQMCMTGGVNQTGSLFHESTDADTFSAWGADLLKYDNCYSEAATGYPNVDYAPVVSPEFRYENMTKALNGTGRSMLFQICDWGVDFPSAWAPRLGNTWRVTNDIIPAWRTIYRIVNQVVPQMSYAGPGHWLDLDMLEVGNNIFTTPEEQTHFSLWAILKSPLTIGAALKDTMTSINSASLAIYKNSDVISLNQDSLGVAANLTRRWTDAGYDVWSGPLSRGRTVAALVNWNNQSITATLDLPDVGLQSAGYVKDLWRNVTTTNVQTSYTATIPAHGTLLLELGNTTAAGEYAVDRCGRVHGNTVTIPNVYGVTSGSYAMTISFSRSSQRSQSIRVSTSESKEGRTFHVQPGKTAVEVPISLLAGDSNSITIQSSLSVSSIAVAPPNGTFYPSTSFSVSGTAKHQNCTVGLCAPVGAKITNLTENGAATLRIPRRSSGSPTNTSVRYVELTYINNEVSLDTSWTNGTNSRNITVAVNGAASVRLDVPLSGHSSELFSPMRGWGDPATLGVLVDGWGTGDGEDTVVVSNVGGNAGVQPDGAHFVGLRVL